jgi:hypothetical protein
MTVNPVQTSFDMTNGSAFIAQPGKEWDHDFTIFNPGGDKADTTNGGIWGTAYLQVKNSQGAWVSKQNYGFYTYGSYNSGKGTIKISALGSYKVFQCRLYMAPCDYTTGATCNFTLALKPSKASFSYDKSDVYNGKAQSANVKAKASGLTFKTYYREQTKGSAYAKATASAPKLPGYYHVYAKVASGYIYLGGYNIYPAAPKYAKAKAYNNAEKVYWSRQASGSNTTGYEIAYRLTSSKSWHYVWVSGRKASSKMVKKLANHKYYYVKARVYKTTYGHKYYSAWTKQYKTPKTK